MGETAWRLFLQRPAALVAGKPPTGALCAGAVVLVVAFTAAAGINTDGRQSVDDASGTFRSQAVSFPGSKLPSNFRSHELSSPTTVALLGRKPTRYSMHHYELFNYDYIAYV